MNCYPVPIRHHLIAINIFLCQDTPENTPNSHQEMSLNESRLRQKIRHDDHSSLSTTHEEFHQSSWAQRVLRWAITVPGSPTDEIERNYQVWGSDKIFFLLGGRFRLSRTRPIILFTAFMSVLAMVLFCVFDAAWCWHNVGAASVILFLYGWLIAVSSFIKAATSDAGVIPRNIHLTEDPYNIPNEYFNSITLPSGDDRQVEIKYCHTCRDWRMPRSFHCARCDQCISIHDHHCIWLNNCVGERNYLYFFMFLLFSTFTTAYLSGLSYYHLLHYQRSHNLTITKALKHNPMSLFNGILGNIMFLYPALLLGYHIYLVFTQQTTREFLKNKFVKKNPYTFNNIFKNALFAIFKPRGSSYVQPRGFYHQGDSRFTKFQIET